MCERSRGAFTDHLKIPVCGDYVVYCVYVPETKVEQAKPDRSVVLTVRISSGADRVITALQEREARDRSDTVRLMLTFAAAHMPEGYKGEPRPRTRRVGR